MIKSSREKRESELTPISFPLSSLRSNRGEIGPSAHFLKVGQSPLTRDTLARVGMPCGLPFLKRKNPFEETNGQLLFFQTRTKQKETLSI